MKIHILLGGALLALLLLEVESRRFDGRGGRGGKGGSGGHRGHGGHGDHGPHNRPDRPRRQNFTMVCSQPPETGLCYARMRMWFFNATSEQCEMFTYGGCGGNANRFWSQRACNHRCSDPCNKPLDMGDECEDGIAGQTRTLFYYDLEENQCKEFEFTGCGGNRNRFRSVKHCAKRCLDRDDEETEDSSETMEEIFDGYMDSELPELVDETDSDDEDDIFETDSDDEDDIFEESDDDSRSRRALRRPVDPNGCPRHQCMMFCRWGFQRDPETGCSKCRCNPPPQNLRSDPEGCPRRRCRIKCEFGLQRDPETGCIVCRCNQEPTRESLSPEVCPSRRCRMRCEFGFKTHPVTGCQSCTCKEGPTQCPSRLCRRRCQFGFKKDSETGCQLCSCNEGPTNCRPVACRMACGDRGFAKGPDGCPVCRCNGVGIVKPLPRRDLNLDTDEEEMEEEEEEARIIRRRCPMIRCRSCRFGHQRDDMGCRTCECNPPPASDLIPENCEERTCRRACPNGFETNEEGCPTCRCKPLTATPPVKLCRVPQCFRACLHGSRPDRHGCPTCDCLPSPSEVENSEDLEDESRSRQRRSHPKPEFLPNVHTPHFCKPIRCPMLNICPFGRDVDNHGCPSCECRGTPRNPGCFQPKVRGLCRGRFPRYFFDATSGKCEGFTYGGCGGNENNFRSIEECREQCEN